MIHQLRIAVLSDIHSNAAAFRAAISVARKTGFDKLLILGDLLTYGCDPNEVLDIAMNIANEGAVFVRGNHDQLYIDLRDGRTDYFDGLPDWLQEVVNWTRSRIGDAPIGGMFPWQNSWSSGKVLFAHANPFGYGDWTYLNAAADFSRAADSLRAAKYAAGVFGHTHRPKAITVTAPGAAPVIRNLVSNENQTFTGLFSNSITILDVGSVGQPRNSEKLSSIGLVTIAEDKIVIEILGVKYDLERHREVTRCSSLSRPTVERLLQFFP